MDMLEKIATLRSSLNADAPTVDQADAWWGQCESIEYEIDSDQRATPAERAAVQRLKDGVSQAMLSVREGWPNVERQFSNLALTSLQNLIERRTVGADGLPLRS